MNKSWRNYEEEAAQLFRQLDYTAIVNAQVAGARGTHAIDVWVTFNRHGLETRWVIECKHWQKRVPKEKVAALDTIDKDIGADRGIILSEVGFQSGAHKIAQNTNITLTSLAQLRNNAEPEFLESRAMQLALRIVDLKLRCDELVTYQHHGNGVIAVNKPGVDRDVSEIQFRLSLLEEALSHARRENFPVLCSIGYNPLTGQHMPMASMDLRDLLSEAERIFYGALLRVERQESNIQNYKTQTKG